MFRPSGLQAEAVYHDERWWVPLRRLVWVLQPEECHDRELAADSDGSRTWALVGADVAKSEQFGRLLTLASYYQSVIETFAEMCYARSYNVIHVLQEHFGYELLCSLVSDDALPHQVGR